MGLGLVGMRACEAGQTPPGTDLEQHTPLVLEQRAHVVGEADGRAEVTHPVVRIGGLLVAEPGSGDVGHHRDLGRGIRQRAKVLAKGRQDGLEHRRVRCDVDRHTAVLDARVIEAALESLDGRHRSRSHTGFRRIHERDVEAVRQMLGERCRRHRDAEHASRRDLLEEPAAGDEEAQRVLERQHPRDARGGVLAHAVAHESARCDRPRHPELRLRVLRDEHRGQRARRPLERLAGGRDCIGLRVEQRLQVEVELGGQERQAAIDRVAIHRLGLIERTAHVGVLGAATTEHEDDFALAGRRASGNRTLLRQERIDRIVDPLACDDPSLLERLTSDLKRERHVGEIRLGMGTQKRGQLVGGVIEGGETLRRQDEELIGTRRRLARWSRRRLFGDDEGIGAADAERVDGSAAPVDTPIGELRIDEEGRRREVDLGVGLLVVQARWDLAVLESACDLDEAHHAGGGVQMADVRLDGTDGAELTLLGLW